jgi:hypothetical protein
MAATTLLPTALRGTTTSPIFNVPNGATGYLQIVMTSPAWAATLGLSWDLVVERSFTGGASWENLCTSGNVSGFGAPGVTQRVALDGRPSQIRATVTVPTPFVWGVSAELLASLP